jgi:hypothetical protein
MKDFLVELKVCEGCGALYLRDAGVCAASHSVYCRGCAAWLSEFPTPRGRNRRVRMNGAGRRHLQLVDGQGRGQGQAQATVVGGGR